MRFNMVFCSNCGAEIEETQKFCPKCGTKNEAAFKEPPEEVSEFEKVSEGSGKQDISKSKTEKEKESKKSILKIDIKDDEVERAKEKAKKGFGAALRMAKRGIDKGREMAEKGIDTAKETIDERKKRQKLKSPEDVKYCPECGQPVPVEAKFCANCGEKLE